MEKWKKRTGGTSTSTKEEVKKKCETSWRYAKQEQVSQSSLKVIITTFKSMIVTDKEGKS